MYPGFFVVFLPVGPDQSGGGRATTIITASGVNLRPKVHGALRESVLLSEQITGHHQTSSESS